MGAENFAIFIPPSIGDFSLIKKRIDENFKRQRFIDPKGHRYSWGILYPANHNIYQRDQETPYHLSNDETDIAEPLLKKSEDSKEECKSMKMGNSIDFTCIIPEKNGAALGKKVGENVCLNITGDYNGGVE